MNGYLFRMKLKPIQTLPFLCICLALSCGGPTPETKTTDMQSETAAKTQKKIETTKKTDVPKTNNRQEKTGAKTKMQRYTASRREMGVVFTIVLYASDAEKAKAGFDAAFGRIREIDATLSDYKPESELSRLSRSAPHTQGVAVGKDLWKVLVRAQEISQLSGGAFDVTVGPLTELWREARHFRKMPPSEQLKKAREAVGYTLVHLNPEKQTVQLTRQGMQLDLGGIAKGYAADEAMRSLQKLGIRRVLVNASGDIVVGDAPPDRKSWVIGIAPLQPGAKPSRLLSLTHAAVATSGDAFQYVEIEGHRYSHIVDPRTGLGVTDHNSVTIIAPDCMTADALASAVTVLGPQAGLKIVEKANLAAYVVRLVEDKVETYQSKQFKKWEKE